ncbi:MAG: signal recognition particle-docking protein FtsY [Candidatus Njordarchaeales archaeon]
MFDRLKVSLNIVVEKLSQQVISEKKLDKILKELELSLIANDVAVGVADEIVKELKKELVGKKVRRFTDIKAFIKSVLRKKILEILTPKESVDLVTLISKRREENIKHMKAGEEWRPFVILFLGPNGSGKTVTIAKLAWLFQKRGFSPVLVASDTFRAGAIEQLEKHAKKLGVTLIRRNYGADPASVAYDAIAHARAKRKDVVLIDTAGRLGTDINLMEEMKKIARVSKPDIKIFIADALAGNDLANQAREFHEKVGIDANILTKVDADVKGGAAITVCYITKAPILYIGVGQKYEDLLPFNAEWFVKQILP